MRDVVNVRLLAIGLLLCCFGFVSKAAITVQTVATTPSTCANNGSISVFATSSNPNPTLLYAIVAGPVTTPIQNNNNFYSLYPGNYTIRLYDANFDSLDTQATVTGTYQLPDLNPTDTDPSCQGTADGIIVGNADSTKGLLPFTWEIISPWYIGPQPLDTFTNLPGGTYQIRMTDACNNFQTRNVVLNSMGSGLGPFGGQISSVYIIGCDTVVVSHMITLYKEAAHIPLEMRVINNANTYTTTVYAIPLDTINYVPGLYEVRDTFVGISYGDHLHLTVSDICGNATYGAFQTVAPFDFRYEYYTPGTGCGNQMGAWARIKSFPYFNYHYTSMRPPVIMTVTDVAAGTVVQRDTCTQSCFGLDIDPLLGGRTYQIHVVDGCGKIYQQNIVWPVPAAAAVQVGPGQGCHDSTATAYMNCHNFRTATTITIHSGPSQVGSSKPGYEHHSTITYPQVYTGMRPGGIALRDLPAGTYTYTVADSCGQSVSGSFTVDPANLADFHYDYSIKRGCQGANTLYVNAYQQSVALMIEDQAGQSIYQRLNYQSGTDSVNSVPPGTYYLFIYYGYSPYGGGVFDTTLVPAYQTCWVVRDTITVHPYNNSTFKSNTTIFCNGITYVELNVDSTKGVPPYQYEISNGPQTFPLQNSNTFQISTLGTYQIRIRDACGNSNIQQITIDSDTFPPVIKKGIMCPSGRVVLAGTSSAYFDYEWERPNGSTFLGDSIVIDPLTVADTGVYHVTKYVHINGCTDTFTNSYHVTFTDSFPQTISICQGDTLFVGTKPYTVDGHYVDTLISVVGCDSIIITDLTVLNSTTTTNNTAICRGDTLRVGTHAYTLAGSYRDSIGNGVCYDIIITNLTVNGSIDTISPTLCWGDTLFVGSSAYTSGGTYRDTLTAAGGCDSIVVSIPIFTYINSVSVYTICAGDSVVAGSSVYRTPGLHYDTVPLPGGCDSFVVSIINVLPPRRDTVDAQMCAGNSYSFGGNSYTAAGTYYDTIATSGCDSIVMLNLTVDVYLRDTVSAVMCAGGSYNFYGNIVNTACICTDTISGPVCDTVITLLLAVLPYPRDTIAASICPNGIYNFYGTLLTAAGTYTDTATGSGCDSIITLQLTIEPYLRDTVNASICPNGSYNFYGNTLTAAGTYTDTVTGPGCDSIITLQLTIAPYLRDTVNASICPNGSYSFYGNSLTAAGTYTDTVIGPGCDSIITLELTIEPYLHDTVNASICPNGSYDFYGNTLTAAGTYTDTVTGPTCDSIITLELAFAPYLRDTIAAVICPGQGFAIGSNIYTQAGTYTDTLPSTGCDSIVTLNLTLAGISTDTLRQTICDGDSFAFGGQTVSQAGMYRDTLNGANGCDSIVVLDLTLESVPNVGILANHTEVYAGDTVLLNTTALTLLNYQWTSGAPLQNPQSQHPRAVVTEPVWITMTAWGNNNCPTVDSIFIDVLEDTTGGCGGKTYLHIPNVFTPNNDGENDRFVIFHHGINLDELKIFNRWGELVYRTTDIDQYWDGTFKGTALPPDVYVYYLTYVPCDGVSELYKEGSITILK